MLRRGLVSTALAAIVLIVLPGVAAAVDLRSPDARDAAEHRGIYALEEDKTYQDLRSPDARDAARDIPARGVSTVTVAVPADPAGGFDWGDAGIGAAAMVALFSIAAGAALLVTGRRRGRSVRVATH